MAQPQRIQLERYGLEAVPAHLRQTSWYEYSMMQAAFAVNAGNFLVPALAVLSGGLSAPAAMLSTSLGAALAFFFVSLLSGPGSRYGIPAQYAIRSILGIRGAQWLASPIRTLTSLYWFSVQTIGGTYVLQEMLYTYFQVQLPFAGIAVSLAVLMTVLALIGFDAVKGMLKRSFPLLLLGQAVLFILLLHYQGGAVPASGHAAPPIMLFYASLAFVQYISGVSSASDMTRYAKSYRHGFYGLYIGNLFGFIVTAVLGAMSAALLHSANPYAAAGQLTDSKWLIALLLLCAMLSMVSINLNNAYTGGLSLLNSIPRLGRIRAALLFGMAAVCVSTLPQLVQEAKSYISFIGAFVVPLSAIIVTDFLLLKKQLLPAVQSARWNTAALWHTAGGALLYWWIPEAYSPGFLTFLLTAASYGAFGRSRR